MALLLSGCVMIPRGDTVQTRCNYPDSPRTPAPAFVCEPNITGFPLTVLRSEASVGEPVDARIERALADQVAQWSSHWSMEWVAVSEQPAVAAFLMEYLQDEARVVRSRTSPTGALWLLIGLPVTEEELKAQILATE